MRTQELASHSLLSLSLLLATAAFGCDAADEDLGAVTLRPWGCTWCGLNTGNSPIINGSVLSNWYLDRTFTGGHEVGPGISSTGVPFKLDVDPLTDRFIGRAVSGADADVDGVILSGAELLGAKFHVINGDTTSVILTISAYDDEVMSWSDSGAPVTAYKAYYYDEQQQPQSLCPEADPNNQWFMLIAGERYDSGVNEVIAAPGSVTLACVGEAAAKMKMMDFHPNGSRQASVEERQATLRMITADYCGTGQSFTAKGTPVAWRDTAGNVSPAVAEVTMEALWDENGALCLEVPRLAEMAEVVEACGELPPCDDWAAAGAVWRTMLPQ